jgi:glycosyltransferase involved in cell wall biosynthesis
MALKNHINGRKLNKKALIIDEQFPFTGGSRTEKFVKYLPKFGWQPLVLTKLENSGKQYAEKILSNYNHRTLKLYQTKAAPDFFLLNKFGLIRIAGILNSFFLIPDINTAWLPFAIKKGIKIINKEKPEIIYSSSPREGVHLIAYFLKKKLGLPWVADFRDLWTLYEGRYKPLTFFHHAINKYIEKSIYSKWSDVVIANTPENKKIIAEKFNVNTNKIRVITNGYDTDDVDLIQNKKCDNGYLTIGFIGGIQKPALCYDEFLQAFAYAIEGGKKIKLLMWSEKSDRLIRLLKKYKGVIDNVEFKQYVPHQQCLRELQQVDVLLVLLAKEYPCVVPQKLYNYLGLKIPIIGIVPEYSRAAKIIIKSRCGFVISPDNIATITNSLIQLHNEWSNGTLTIKPRLEILFEYRRDTLTKKLVQIFNNICR